MLRAKHVEMESPLMLEECMSHITHRLEDHLPTYGFGWKIAEFNARFGDEEEPRFVLTLERGFFGVILRGTLQPHSSGTKLTDEMSTTPLTKVLIGVQVYIGVLLLICAIWGVWEQTLVGMLGGLFFIGFAIRLSEEIVWGHAFGCAAAYPTRRR